MTPIIPWEISRLFMEDKNIVLQKNSKFNIVKFKKSLCFDHLLKSKAVNATSGTTMQFWIN